MLKLNRQIKCFFILGLISLAMLSCQNYIPHRVIQAEEHCAGETSCRDKFPLSGLIKQFSEQKTQTNEKTPRCYEGLDQGSFVFIGQVREILPYQERRLSEQIADYYHPKKGFEPQKTVRFAVEKIYEKLRDRDGEVKELMVDVFSSAEKDAPFFELGECYLVYATPRTYGKNDYSLKDNLIVYPHYFAAPVSQSEERIRALENAPPAPTPNEIFGIDPKERIFTGGLVSGKAKSLVTPKYPEEARAEKATGRVNVQVLVSETGEIIKAKTVCSPHPALSKAAEDAALKSKYSPFIVSGKPVKVTGVIVYNFNPE